MKHEVFQAVGYLGAFLFILSYYLLSIGKLTAQKPTYQIMNVFGAICLVVNATSLKDFPTVLVNGIWFLIGLVSLIRIKRGEH